MNDSREREILNRLKVLQDQMDQVMDSLSIIVRLGFMSRNMERSIMAKIEDVQAKADQELAALQAETNVVNAVKQVVDNQNTKLADLKAQIAELLASGASPAQVQALSDTIDNIMSTDTANAAVVAAAVVAGTPAETPPA